jgi:hypothetical protein
MAYEIPGDLTFENLGEFVKKILISYSANEIGLGDVVDYGSDIEDLLWEKFGDPENPLFPNFEETNHLSIATEVTWCMHHLDLEKGLVMLPRDVPHFLEFLDTPRGQELEGWKKIREYIAGLKIEDRIEEEERNGFRRSKSLPEQN